MAKPEQRNSIPDHENIGRAWKIALAEAPYRDMGSNARKAGRLPAARTADALAKEAGVLAGAVIDLQGKKVRIDPGGPEIPDYQGHTAFAAGTLRNILVHGLPGGRPLGTTLADW